ncbi:hypothetical protein ElyMa_001539400 [Elysia marginata]|uniref:Uncharacterized protein n=1 Tax=Elysia marginata TaxID=1093978 RepID=A0AAV4JBW2_9GAST|nr:hypothetical protein ElyMa_001539400 [Elysia marginata]
MEMVVKERMSIQPIQENSPDTSGVNPDSLESLENKARNSRQNTPEQKTGCPFLSLLTTGSVITEIRTKIAAGLDDRGEVFRRTYFKASAEDSRPRRPERLLLFC